jgi:hypothetical protein
MHASAHRLGGGAERMLGAGASAAGFAGTGPRDPPETVPLVRLTRRGILTQPSMEEPSRATCERPHRSVALLSSWHESLEGLERGYSLGHFLALLRELEDAKSLSPLLQCDVPAFLAEVGSPGTGDVSEPITRLQLGNVAELTNYKEDPSQPDEPLPWLEGAEAADRDARDAAVASLTGEPAPSALRAMKVHETPVTKADLGVSDGLTLFGTTMGCPRAA